MERQETLSLLLFIQKTTLTPNLSLKFVFGLFLILTSIFNYFIKNFPFHLVVSRDFFLPALLQFH